jgi:hypothetical protein
MSRVLLLKDATPRVAAAVALGLTRQLQLPDQPLALCVSYYRVLKAAALLASHGGPAAPSLNMLIEQFHECGKPTPSR